MNDDELLRIRALEEQVREMREWMAQHKEQYQLDLPTLSVLRHIAGFSAVVRWIMIGALGLLSAIGALQLAIDSVSRWVSK